MKTLFHNSKAIALFNSTATLTNQKIVRCHLYNYGLNLNYLCSFSIEFNSLEAEHFTACSLNGHLIELTATKNHISYYFVYNMHTAKLSVYNSLQHTSSISPFKLQWNNIANKINKYLGVQEELSYS